MAPTTGFVTVAGGQLYYEEQGQGQALVLIHGGLVDRRMWDDQFGPFAADYRAIRYDLRGFGRSTSPQQRYSHFQDLSDVLTQLEVGCVHLIGSSYGGALAVDYTLAHPAAV